MLKVKNDSNVPWHTVKIYIHSKPKGPDKF
ncbi:hypothetical protein BH23THE1_BH23THE1_27750 [soil metagenome]